MRFSLNSAVLIGSGLLLAALTIGAAVSYRNVQQLQVDYEWVAHTHKVQTALAELSSSITGMRTRLFDLTANGLEESLQTLEDAEVQRQSLVRLTSDNPQQQARLVQLSAALQQFREIAEKIAKSSKSGDQPPEFSSQLERHIGAAREIEDAMTAEEARLLDARSQAAEQAHRIRLAVWLAMVSLGTLLLIGVARMIHLTAKRQQETTLAVAQESQRREEQLRQVADAVPQIVWITAADGQVLYFNQRWYEYIGCTPAECLGGNWINFLHPDDRERTSERWQESVSAASPYEIEYRFRSAQEQYRWFLSRGLPVLDEHGAIGRWFGTCTDIHEIKQVREQLAASEDFLRSSLDALSSHIAVLNEAGTILSVNRAWIQFAEENDWQMPHHGVGCNYLEACGKLTSGEEEQPVEARRLIELVLKGELSHGELEYPCHSPLEERWFMMRVTRFSRGGEVRVVVSHENISDRVIAAREANLRTEQLRAAAELTLQINAAEDAEGILLTLTHGARRLIGAYFAATCEISAEEDCVDCNRHSLAPAFPSELPNSTVENLARLANTACAARGSAQLDNSELQPEPVWQEFCAQGPLALAAGGLLAVRFPGGSGRASTLLYLAGKKRQLNFNADDEAVLVQLAQLAAVAIQKTQLATDREHSNRRKDEFLATLAHELRNPLTSLYSAAQLLELEADQPDNVRDYAAITQRQCEQLSRLIDDLLDVSRIATGKLQLKREIFAVQEAVTTALDMSQPLIASASHQLVTDICGEPLTIEGDRARVAQIIANLLVNAAKYTPAGGQLAFAVQRGEDAVKITVRDNGIGIAPEMLPHVFELFSQADTTDTRAQGGLGIGLTLVRTLVDMHGGHITAASAGLGQGSEFIVTLPLTSERVALESPAPQPVSTNGRPARFLIVDDNRAAVYLLEKLLVKLGQTVAVANSGEEAISLAPEFQPDIVFSDIAMPGMSGYELLPNLVERLAPHRPFFVALTGYGQELDRARSEEAGFDRHLVKPISIETLRELIASWAPQAVEVL